MGPAAGRAIRPDSPAPRQWHRWLGIFGVGWAGLVVLMGATTTLRASMREVRGQTEFAPMQLTVTGLELTQMVLFGLLVAGAMWWRRRPGMHAGLMLLTIITMLPSVLARLPVDLLPNNDWILWTLDAVLLLLIGIDTARERRLHPAFGWGGLSIVVGLHLAIHGAYTSAWRSFLSRVVS